MDRGRPRVHIDRKARVTAWARKASAEGLVRVSVMVPASKAPDIRAIAEAMRRTSKDRRKAVGLVPVDPNFPNAKRRWSELDDATLRRTWQDGGTVSELTTGLGRTLDEVLQRLVDLEEVGSIREARNEAGARSRFGG